MEIWHFLIGSAAFIEGGGQDGQKITELLAHARLYWSPNESKIRMSATSTFAILTPTVLGC